MQVFEALTTKWYWALILGSIVGGIMLFRFSDRLRQPSRINSILNGTAAALLMLSVFFLSGAAGLLAIVVIDFVETYPRFGFLSRLVLYYLLVLPMSWLLAQGAARLVPRCPKWLVYAVFVLALGGGTYVLFWSDLATAF